MVLATNADTRDGRTVAQKTIASARGRTCQQKNVKMASPLAARQHQSCWPPRRQVKKGAAAEPGGREV
jgi:hypothetical protein